MLNGVYQFNPWMAGFAGLSVILGAVYMLRSYQSIMLGETNGITSSFAPLETSEKAVLIIICAAIIVFGVFPKPLTDIVSPAVDQLVAGLRIAVGK